MTEELLSGVKAAAYLNISRMTFNEWRKAGTLQPQFSHTELTLYSRAHLDQVKTEKMPEGKLKRGQPRSQSEYPADK